MEIVLRWRDSGISIVTWKKIAEGFLILVLLCSIYEGVRIDPGDGMTRNERITVSNGMLLMNCDIDIRGNIKSLPVNLFAQFKEKNVKLQITKKMETAMGAPKADERLTAGVPGDDKELLENKLQQTICLPQTANQNIGQSRQEHNTITGSEEALAIEEGGSLADDSFSIREIAGFCIDEQGYITGITERCSIVDGILVIASDEKCVGIRENAFIGIEEEVMEVYIPANICDIESGAFSDFSSLMYIEVDKENPCYYSIDGILYSKTNEIIVCPGGR